ncbi:MAG TPA: NrfD/PsrC family molybdoenzyme membrane anchor subunit [Chloroflexota bacterium]|nr:NrfD/PsrC family molybdoenzyme membrane anchor subunit [Chloroflexota bacterium]
MSDGAARPHQYGRHTHRAPGEPPSEAGRRRAEDQFRPYQGEHYYDLPVVKPSSWRWLVTSYFFVGGLAGAAQIVATMADLFGGPSQRPVVRAGRYLAFIGTLISPVLLILDLHTPARWYNMLRIARRTSPMSIGSWILSAFGLASSIAVAAEIFAQRSNRPRVPGFGRIAGIAGAVIGTAMSTYTATLLSATSTPLWLTGARHLPVLFGSTAMASAAAATSLTLDATSNDMAHRRPLSALAMLSAIAQLWSMRGLESAWSGSGIQSPNDEPSLHILDTALVKGVGIAAPMVVHLTMLGTGIGLRYLNVLAAIATLAGGFAERWLIVTAGNRSTNRPSDYFGISQPAMSEPHGP